MARPHQKPRSASDALRVGDLRDPSRELSAQEGWSRLNALIVAASVAVFLLEAVSPIAILHVAPYLRGALQVTHSPALQQQLAIVYSAFTQRHDGLHDLVASSDVGFTACWLPSTNG